MLNASDYSMSVYVFYVSFIIFFLFFQCNF